MGEDSCGQWAHGGEQATSSSSFWRWREQHFPMHSTQPHWFLCHLQQGTTAHGRSCYMSPPWAVGEGAALLVTQTGWMDGGSYLGTGICSQTCRLGKAGQRMSEVLPKRREGSRFLLSLQPDPSPSKHWVYIKHQFGT